MNPDTAASGLSASLETALEQLQANPGQEQAWALIAKLREQIRNTPEEEAAVVLVKFLKRGADAQTGLPFTVGIDGMMDAVPTLRIALLDQLPSLDPTAALELARELMEAKTSPDEYALSLRNLAWNDLDGDLKTELSARFLEMLATPWVNDPSAGFLEAFDVAVEVGGQSMFDRMISVASDAQARSDDALAQAAHISLDRMIVRDPSVLKGLETGTGWMDFAPIPRASLMSRLDIGEPWQRDLFTRYLVSNPHAAGELDYFSELYPNRNYLHGHRLVTADDATPGLPQVVADDAKVHAMLKTLDLTSNPDAVSAVGKIIRRLEPEVAK